MHLNTSPFFFLVIYEYIFFLFIALSINTKQIYLQGFFFLPGNCFFYFIYACM